MKIKMSELYVISHDGIHLFNPEVYDKVEACKLLNDLTANEYPHAEMLTLDRAIRETYLLDVIKVDQKKLAEFTIEFEEAGQANNAIKIKSFISSREGKKRIPEFNVSKSSLFQLKCNLSDLNELLFKGIDQTILTFLERCKVCETVQMKEDLIEIPIEKKSAMVCKKHFEEIVK